MTKTQLRKEYLTKRKALLQAEIQSASQRICDWLFRSLPIHSYSTIHTFLPIKKQNEVDTWLIIKTLRDDFSTNIVIPKANPDGTLTNYLLTENTLLEENQWGIPEISDLGFENLELNVNNVQNLKSETPSQEIDMVLIPLLAFDKSGYRVGYGKGYYDRFLTECRSDTLKVGLSIFEPIEAISDLNNFDIKLDFCITPQKIWQF